MPREFDRFNARIMSCLTRDYKFSLVLLVNTGFGTGGLNIGSLDVTLGRVGSPPLCGKKGSSKRGPSAGSSACALACSCSSSASVTAGFSKIW